MLKLEDENYQNFSKVDHLTAREKSHKGVVRFIVSLKKIVFFIQIGHDPWEISLEGRDVFSLPKKNWIFSLLNLLSPYQAKKTQYNQNHTQNISMTYDLTHVSI